MAHYRCRQPEGRRRQDHHNDQPRSITRAGPINASSWSTSIRKETSQAGSDKKGKAAGRRARSTTRSHLPSRWPTPQPYIIPTCVDRLDLIPADRNLTGAEIELVTLPHREERLRVLLSGIGRQYDYVFIDCPPSLGLLTLNALVAADAVLIPLHCEYFALEGLADLVGTMRRVRAALNPALDIEGVLLTMFDERTNLGQQVATDVRSFFKEKVFRTVIPRNVRLGEAPSHGMPVILYDVKSRGAEAYMALAREVLARSAATAA